ncbi:MAG: iron-containing alcohol dehydrogenase [Myxococcota bacterium]
MTPERIEGPHLETLGTLLRDRGYATVLLFSDHGVKAAGHVRSAMAALQAAEIGVTTWLGVQPEPTAGQVERAASALAGVEVDAYVALGGGSVIDFAKAVNFLVIHGGVMADFKGHDQATRPMRPLIAIPTTAGTGSEMQSFALISDEVTHRKMACGDPSARPVLSILDPRLTLTLPEHITLLSALDAMVHTLETAVTTRRTPASLALSATAFSHLHEGLPRVLRNPDDLGARTLVMRGASMAGEAIEMSMLGAAHATGNALSSVFGTAHGAAVGHMAPAVMALNSSSESAREGYATLCSAAGLPTEGAAEQLCGVIRPLLGHPALPACPDLTTRLPELIEDAQSQWTGTFNPVPLTPNILRDLFLDTARRIP